jgi:hypothetical protein
MGPKSYALLPSTNENITVGETTAAQQHTSHHLGLVALRARLFGEAIAELSSSARTAAQRAR